MNTSQLPKPVIYIWINKGLKMSAGKVASQAAHAAALVFGQLAREDIETFWVEQPHRTVIVFEARDEMHLWNIQGYLADRKIDTELIVDEGANEIPPHSATALCTVLLDKNEKTDKLMSTFTLYKDEPEYIYVTNFQTPLVRFQDVS